MEGCSWAYLALAFAAGLAVSGAAWAYLLRVSMKNTEDAIRIIRELKGAPDDRAG